MQQLGVKRHDCVAKVCGSQLVQRQLVEHALDDRAAKAIVQLQPPAKRVPTVFVERTRGALADHQHAVTALRAERGMNEAGQICADDNQVIMGRYCAQKCGIRALTWAAGGKE